MSVPALAAGAPVSSIGPMVLGPLDSAILSLNSNPYFIGTMMLLLNLGGRFISLEMSKNQEEFFQNPWVRRLLIFTVLFVGTRNVVVAFWMTLFIILIIGYLFNENSSLCLFHLGKSGTSCAEGPTSSQLQAQMTPATPFTPEEAEIFKRLNDKQLRFAATQRQKQTRTPEQFPQNLQDIYLKNMVLIKNSDGTFGNPRF
jgi:hypothetical protein